MAKKHVHAHITGTVWKITVEPGAQIGEEDTVVILESMKMEMPVEAGTAGKIVEILVKEGQAVQEGQPIASIEE